MVQSICSAEVCALKPKVNTFLPNKTTRIKAHSKCVEQTWQTENLLASGSLPCMLCSVKGAGRQFMLPIKVPPYSISAHPVANRLLNLPKLDFVQTALITEM